MPPPFELQGGVPLCAAHAVLVAASLSGFGALLFGSLVAPRAYARMVPEAVAADRARLRGVIRASVVTGLFAAVTWLVLEAGYMADADGLVAAATAVPTVLAKTVFGHFLLAQIACLTLLLALLGPAPGPVRRCVALGAATFSVALEAGHSHAFSMHDGASLLLACDVLHLVAAGGWLGGLLPLLLLVGDAPPRAGALAARWFSPLGRACVAALVLSSAFQAWVLVATIPGLVGTAYGWMVLVKLALSAVLLGFAAANRYRFAPALLCDHPDRARRVLVRSVLLQTGFAVAIVGAAAVLSALPPAMHEEPTWPFAERFSLAAIDHDPALRRTVLLAVVSVAAAVLLLVLSLIRRRLRLAAGALLALAACCTVAVFARLLVPATPDSFYRSPTGFSAASIVTGRTIYAQHCAACHGSDGGGEGPVAANPKVAPPDLTTATLRRHSDGDLFWWIAHGIRMPHGGQVMPALASVMDDEQRWAVIDFLRARNASAGLGRNGDWSPPPPAPGFDAECASATIKSGALRGKFVMLRFAASAAPAQQTVVTILPGAGSPPGPAIRCVNRDEMVKRAYGIVSGLDAQAVSGATFLIDDRGWLRALQRPGAGPAWSDPSSLKAEIGVLSAHPLEGGATAPMRMPMDRAR